MYIILDWQNEDNITILKDHKTEETLRFKHIEDATKRLSVECVLTNNIYLNIVRIG